MATAIKIIAQHYELDTGEILEENVLRTDKVVAPSELKELGYLHLEQIELISKCQEFKIGQQIKLINNTTTCPKCENKVTQKGKYTSKFHGYFSDHSVTIKRIYCTCGCKLPYTVEGIFGSTTHPDLLKRQAELASEISYEKASKELNNDVGIERSVNNRTNINRVAIKVSEIIENIKTTRSEIPDAGVDELVMHIDGGHLKKRGEGRSFEAMAAVVYDPSNIFYIDKNHNAIDSKHIVASSKDDQQESIKNQLRNACLNEGMGENTEIICLADGADNCWSIAESIAKDCRSITLILDWFHIGEKFKNMQSAVSDDLKNLYDEAKWSLWHGNVDKSLSKIVDIKNKTEDESSVKKLDKLETYIHNNKDRIVNYDDRKEKGLVYASSYAESTINRLINTRQKKNQQMSWTREGAHHILQIRASILSDTWNQDWENIEKQIYLKTA